jgi:hypothetical protein
MKLFDVPVSALEFLSEIGFRLQTLSNNIHKYIKSQWSVMVQCPCTTQFHTPQDKSTVLLTKRAFFDNILGYIHKGYFYVFIGII